MKSDTQLIFEHIEANKPSQFTGATITQQVKRADGSEMRYGSVSSSLSRLVKLKVIKVVGQEPSSVAHIPRNIYGYLGQHKEGTTFRSLPKHTNGKAKVGYSGDTKTQLKAISSIALELHNRLEAAIDTLETSVDLSSLTKDQIFSELQKRVSV